MENYTPRYLDIQSRRQAAEDQEAIDMVKHNPNRVVNADALPPIVMEYDGSMYFMPKAEPRQDHNSAIGFLAIVAGVASAAFGVACAWFTGSITPLGLTGCVLAAVLVTALDCMKGD